MKKVLALLTVSALLFTACSENRNYCESPAAIIISPDIKNIDEGTALQAFNDHLTDSHFSVSLGLGGMIR